MNRFIPRLAAITSWALAGCSLVAPKEGRLADLDLSPSDSVLVAPSTVLLRGRNTSGETLWYNSCTAGVHRLDSDIWSRNPVFTGVVSCAAVAVSLSKGQDLSFAVNVPTGSSPGTYRVQLRLTTDDDREVLAISSPFRIQ